MLRFRSLASGSAGNATLVEARCGLQTSRVLIDCGLGQRQLSQRLAAVDRSIEQIDAIFITHEHGDHVGCALQVAARHRIALWMSVGTWQHLEPRAQTADLDLDLHFAADGDVLALGAVELRPFTVPHDAREPLQLHCSDGDRRLGLLTDLGHASPHALRELAGCHSLLLESNHDPELLAQSSYPEFLKRRIAGSLGHLSNSQAAAALQQLQHPQLKQVVAAHLSERTNRPELARQALAEALQCCAEDILTAGPQGLGWLNA